MKISNQTNYIALMSSIGSALEYYCFITYILLSSYISELFFPASSGNTAMLYTLLLFAVSYLVMPISAVSFGFFADRIGRKQVMVIALMLMAVATFAIGILPAYQTIGITATISLFGLRILQGLAQGAELPGAITFISEHAQDKNQGVLCGVLFFAVGTGALLSTFVNYLLTSFLSRQEMLSYGWRIPFLLAGLLGIIGWQIRQITTETPLFLQQQKIEIARVPIFTLLKDYFPQVLIGFSLVWSGAVLVNFGLFLPSFLQLNFGYSPRDTYLATTLVFAMDFLLIIFGLIADKITLKRFYLIGIIINLIVIYPLCYLLNFKSVVVLFVFSMLYHLLILFLAASYPAMIARIFPTKVRYSGVALAYLGAYSIAGLAPLIINKIYLYFNNLTALAVCLLLPCALSLIAVMFYRD